MDTSSSTNAYLDTDVTRGATLLKFEATQTYYFFKLWQNIYVIPER